ncbi:hypothetical protein KI387_000545, partial [Taxus chinensis]
DKEAMGEKDKPAKTMDEPAMGIPYAYPAKPMQTVMTPPPQQYYCSNPYQAGMIPPNAIFGYSEGIPLWETVYRDTPAPFECTHCSKSGLTNIKLLDHYPPSFSFPTRLGRLYSAPMCKITCFRRLVEERLHAS